MSRSAILLTAALLTGCFGAKKDVSEYISRAKQYITEGNRTKAELELRQAIKLAPRDAQANLQLARLEEEDGDYDAALPHYVIAASPEARLVDAQLRLIDILLDAARFQEAGAQINTTLGAFPSNVDALALRADLEDRQGQPGPAAADAVTTLSKDPTNARALAVQAVAALRGKNLDLALSKIDKGLASHPVDVRLLQLRAAVYATSNQPDKAISALKQIVQSSPRNLSAQIALAEVEAGNGKVDAAVQDFRTAVDNNPTDQKLQLAFVQFLVAHKSRNEVIAYLREMIGRDPNHGLYDLALAGYYRHEGELKESRDVLEAALKRLGTSDDALSVRVAKANIDYDLGHKDVAEDDIATILKADPKNTEALMFRARLRLAGGRLSDAVTDLLDVAKQEPANVSVYSDLANAYLAQGRTGEAADAMRRVAALSPADRGAQLRLAAFLQKAGQITDARELMARLILANPTDKSVWITAAQIALLQNDVGSVGRAVSRLRELAADESVVAMLQGQVAAARGDDLTAMKQLQSAIATSSEPDPAVLNAYVAAARNAGKQADAAAFLDQRTPSLTPQARTFALLLLMEMQSGADQKTQLASTFEKLVQLNASNPDIYARYAGILARQKDFDKARGVLAAGLAAGVPRSTILLTSGWVESVAGNMPAARDAFKEAMQLDPSSLDAANNYASIIADEQPRDNAELANVRERLSGAESHPNPAVVDTVAWIDYRLGRYDEAKALLSRIKAGESTDPQLRFHMGAVLVASGNRDGGLKLLNSVKGLDFPGSTEARTLSES